MEKTKLNRASASCSIALDPITGSVEILNAKGQKASAFQILGYMFVAGAHFLADIFTGSNHEELSTEEFANYLENEQLEIKQDDKGCYYLAVGEKNVSELLPTYDPYILYGFVSTRKKLPIKVEKKQGNRIYHIHNLNIYITADVVQQLNVNPEQVVNLIQDKLMEEIDKLGCEKLGK